VTSPVWLIAEREFRTYVMTLSFWVALAIGPVAACIVFLLPITHLPAPAIAIRGSDAALVRSLTSALADAGQLDGRHFRFASDSTARVTLVRTAPARLELQFSDGFPLSVIGRALVARSLERDAARDASGGMVLAVHENHAVTAHGPDAAALSRFAAMMMLWLTLTGAMGMLLQTVVRERASRALESLLAAASPRSIVAGKIAGVGAISLLVVAAWLGSAAILSIFLPADAGLARAIVTGLADPVSLMRDAVIYLFAYAFYGAVTVMLGALARDTASAQNLSRPMFVLLLAGFFLALSCVAAGSKVSVFIYLPPFTPFLLLVYPVGAVAALTQVLLLGVLALAAWASLTFSASFLSVSPDSHQIFGRAKRVILPLAQ
jgi:ABC-type Na+ efflux pump permease subunit